MYAPFEFFVSTISSFAAQQGVSVSEGWEAFGHAFERPGRLFLRVAMERLCQPVCQGVFQGEKRVLRKVQAIQLQLQQNHRFARRNETFIVVFALTEYDVLIKMCTISKMDFYSRPGKPSRWSCRPRLNWVSSACPTFPLRNFGVPRPLETIF